ncbi:hypothetical protein SY88_10325 [Clostridiales bacterium PH28_bin88]|nr:hypothetical protein SY88_10325 [Clostridiales bacterium PH28_bin88]
MGKTIYTRMTVGLAVAAMVLLVGCGPTETGTPASGGTSTKEQVVSPGLSSQEGLYAQIPVQQNSIQEIDLSFTPEFIEVLEIVQLDKEWVKVKSVEVLDVAGNLKVVIHLYMKPGASESDRGVVRAALEDQGNMYDLKAVGDNGLDSVSIEAKDINHNGTNELIITGSMGAAYIERNIVSFIPAEKRWVKLLTMGTPWEIDLDGDGKDDVVAVSGGVLPGYVLIYRWNEDHFERADVAEATGNFYAIPQQTDGKVWIQSGKPDEPPRYYQYLNGKLVEIPEPPVSQSR